MNEISCETSYISVSCNRYSHCIDCQKGLICFATKHSIAVYCIRTYKIVKLLNGHKSQVNSVKWISSNENLLISSSYDKTAIIWDLNDLNEYRIKYQLIGHKESVTLSDSCLFNDNQLLSITCSTDKCLKIWLNDKQLTQLFNNNFIFDFKICKNEDIFNDIVIITVGANETINLYQFNANNCQINCLIELKGHEDWIRSVDIFETKKNHLLVASSSQDCFIRVHQIERIDGNDSDINDKTFSMQTNDNKQNYLVRLETVLAGHEGWVSQVVWHQSCDNRLQLLSVSMDKTMILWQSPNDTELDDLWVECVRVGEMGGNTLGFLGCASSPELNLIIGYSFNGALHMWKCCEEVWKPCVTIGGHFDDVTDISWEPKGEYLLSTSVDQTTRLHSVWVSDETSDESGSWHEMARPQIHGYDIKCIAMIGRHGFVSGADEKVLRVFRATKCFASSLQQVSKVDISSDISDEDVAHSATVPTLGLSNCAVYEPERVDYDFRPTVLDVPPTEETLLQNTLWPEIHKLYGHVYELFSVAVSASRTVVASASKATKSEHSNIILWDVREGKQMAKLSSHQLTVTRIRFSSDDRYILSSSRDRTWALFERKDNEFNYLRIAFTDKKTGIHSRIIWDCALTHDNQYFVTVSRDKSAIIWSIDSNVSNSESSLGPVKATDSPLTLSDSITTVDICKTTFRNNYLIAFGLENGKSCLYFWNNKTFWTHLLDLNDSHTLTVNRMQFSPKIDKRSDGLIGVKLGSCGADNSVRIFQLLLNQ